MQKFKQKISEVFTYSHLRMGIFVGGMVGLVLISILGPVVRAHFFAPSNNIWRTIGGETSVHVIDVGFGDAVAIRTADGRVILIDTGPEMHSSRVRDYLRRRVVGRDGRIDYLIITHDNEWHHGGVRHILNEFNVGTAIITNATKEHNELSTLMFERSDMPITGSVVDKGFLRSRTQRQLVAHAGLEIYGRGFSLFMHTPTEEYIHMAVGANASPIMTLTVASHIFLLTGATTLAGEFMFLQSESARAIFPQSRRDVHIVTSLASGAMMSDALLNFVNPKSVTVSVGSNEDFPNYETYNRIRRFVGRENVHITRDRGHVAMQTHGGNLLWYFGFRNSAQLWWLSVMIGIAIPVLSFARYRREDLLPDGTVDRTVDNADKSTLMPERQRYGEDNGAVASGVSDDGDKVDDFETELDIENDDNAPKAVLV